MASRSSVFPAFIRAEYDPSGGGFPAFEQAARASADRARTHFQSSFTEIQRLAQQALAAPRNAGGSLDLNAGQYREAAAAAQAHATALREVSTAAQRAALANGDTSEATRLYLQAARAAALEAENNARAAGQQAVAMDRLQAELNQSASATQAVIGSNRALAASNEQVALSARAARFGSAQLGQQFADVAIQAQAGVGASTILIQQGTQAAFALSQMGGAVGRVGAILAGPFGTALFLAGAALTAFLTKTDETKDSLDNLVQSADSFGNAQSALGNVMDLVTGKFSDHNVVLRETIRLQALVGIQDAQKAQRENAKALLDFGRGTFGENFRAAFAGANDPALGARIASEDRAARQPLNQVLNSFLSGRLASKDDPTGTQAAIRQIEALGAAGRSAGRDLIELKKAILAVGINRNDIEANQAILDALDGKGLDPRLRQERKARKPRDRSGEIERLEEFGEDAARRIADISGRFSGQPKLIEQVAKASRQLDDILDDIERRKPPNYEDLVASAKEARAVLEAAPAEPFREMLDALDREAEVGNLLAQGREEEAELLREKLVLMDQLGAEDEAHLAGILKAAGVEGDVNALLRDRLDLLRQQARQQEILRREETAYLGAIADIRSNIQQTIEFAGDRGLASIGDFAEGLAATFKRLTSEIITQRFFDPIFDQLRKEIEDDPLKKAARESADALDVAAGSALDLAGAFDSLRASVSGAGGGLDADGLGAMIAANNAALASGLATVLRDAANDNEASEIVVTGSKLERLTPVGLFNRISSDLLQSIGVSKELADEIGKLGSLLEGAGIGSFAGGLLLGQRNSQTGSAIGGALGKVAGEALGNTLGQLFGQTVGQFAGPLGSVVGGIAGGLIGGLFSSTKRASATIGFDSAGNLIVASTTGNSRSRERASTEAATSAIATIERIAEALGADILPGVGSVSIGMRKGEYRVDPTGQGQTRLSRGAISFGEDAEAAVRAATLDLIKDGILGGLRASTQRLLEGAEDLELGIDKALRFESVFTRLKEHLNPVGAAIDALDREFKSLRKIFEEAGASASEFADLQKLYDLERAEAIKEATERMTGALQGLLDDLTVDNETRSLRERLAAAMAEFNPLSEKIASGNFTSGDADDFAEAARNVLDLQRQIYGSRSEYFELEERIEALTRKALEERQELIDSATGDGPANDNQPVVDAIDRLGDYLGGILLGELGAVNRNIGSLGHRMGGGGRVAENFAGSALNF